MFIISWLVVLFDGSLANSWWRSIYETLFASESFVKFCRFKAKMLAAYLLKLGWEFCDHCRANCLVEIGKVFYVFFIQIDHMDCFEAPDVLRKVLWVNVVSCSQSLWGCAIHIFNNLDIFKWIKLLKTPHFSKCNWILRMSSVARWSCSDPWNWLSCALDALAGTAGRLLEDWEDRRDRCHTLSHRVTTWRIAQDQHRTTTISTLSDHYLLHIATLTS